MWVLIDCTRRMSQFTNLLSNISVLVFIHITKSAFLSNPACTADAFGPSMIPLLKLAR